MERKQFIVLCLAVFMSIPFVSCGNDEESAEPVKNKEGLPFNPSGTYNGERLKSVDKIIFSYNENGYVNSIKNTNSLYNEWTENYTFSDDMKDVRKDVQGGGSPGTYSMTYNSLGYVQSISWTGDQTWRDGRSKQWEFTYDKEGHLLTISMGGSLGSALYTFVWKDGCLIKGGRGVNATSGYSNVYDFSYFAKIKNVTLQYDYNMAKMLYEPFFQYLAYLGYMGKGSIYLPDDCRSTISQEEGDISINKPWTPQEGRIKYTFTDKGALKSEVTNMVINYIYE